MSNQGLDGKIGSEASVRAPSTVPLLPSLLPWLNNNHLPLLLLHFSRLNSEAEITLGRQNIFSRMFMMFLPTNANPIYDSEGRCPLNPEIWWCILCRFCCIESDVLYHFCQDHNTTEPSSKLYNRRQGIFFFLSYMFVFLCLKQLQLKQFVCTEMDIIPRIRTQMELDKHVSMSTEWPKW